MRGVKDAVDVLIRAAKTAVEALVAILGAEAADLIGQLAAWKSVTIAVGAGVVAAVWNAILVAVNSVKEGAE